MPCRGCFTPKKDLVLIVQEAGWAPGPVYTGAENLAPTGIQSLNHPAHSELLYWLRYLGSLLPNFSQSKYLRPKAWNPTQNFYSCLIIKLFFTYIFFFTAIPCQWVSLIWSALFILIYIWVPHCLKFVVTVGYAMHWVNSYSLKMMERCIKNYVQHVHSPMQIERREYCANNSMET
jgi:hypothetical protein